MTRSRLSKAEFATHLCDPEVWEKAFSAENIKNGFRRCGIFPVDSTQYPEHRFSINLKIRYDKWVEEGKPDISAEEIDKLVVESQEGKEEAEILEEDSSFDDSLSSNRINTPATDTTESVTINGKKGKILSFFVSDEKPTEMQRVTQGSSTSFSLASFKKLALKKIDSLQTPKSTKPPEKRRKVNPLGGIVTSDEQFEEIISEGKRKEQTKKEKKAKEDKPTKK